MTTELKRIAYSLYQELGLLTKTYNRENLIAEIQRDVQERRKPALEKIRALQLIDTREKVVSLLDQFVTLADELVEKGFAHLTEEEKNYLLDENELNLHGLIKLIETRIDGAVAQISDQINQNLASNEIDFDLFQTYSDQIDALNTVHQLEEVAVSLGEFVLPNLDIKTIFAQNEKLHSDFEATTSVQENAMNTEKAAKHFGMTVSRLEKIIENELEVDIQYIIYEDEYNLLHIDLLKSGIDALIEKGYAFREEAVADVTDEPEIRIEEQPEDQGKSLPIFSLDKAIEKGLKDYLQYSYLAIQQDEEGQPLYESYSQVVERLSEGRERFLKEDLQTTLYRTHLKIGRDFEDRAKIYAGRNGIKDWSQVLTADVMTNIGAIKKNTYEYYQYIRAHYGHLTIGEFLTRFYSPRGEVIYTIPSPDGEETTQALTNQSEQETTKDIAASLLKLIFATDSDGIFTYLSVSEMVDHLLPMYQTDDMTPEGVSKLRTKIHNAKTVMKTGLQNKGELKDKFAEVVKLYNPKSEQVKQILLEVAQAHPELTLGEFFTYFYDRFGYIEEGWASWDSLMESQTPEDAQKLEIHVRTLIRTNQLVIGTDYQYFYNGIAFSQDGLAKIEDQVRSFSRESVTLRTEEPIDSAEFLLTWLATDNLGRPQHSSIARLLRDHGIEPGSGEDAKYYQAIANLRTAITKAEKELAKTTPIDHPILMWQVIELLEGKSRKDSAVHVISGYVRWKYGHLKPNEFMGLLKRRTENFSLPRNQYGPYSFEGNFFLSHFLRANAKKLERMVEIFVELNPNADFDSLMSMLGTYRLRESNNYADFQEWLMAFHEYVYDSQLELNQKQRARIKTEYQSTADVLLDNAFNRRPEVEAYQSTRSFQTHGDPNLFAYKTLIALNWEASAAFEKAQPDQNSLVRELHQLINQLGVEDWEAFKKKHLNGLHK